MKFLVIGAGLAGITIANDLLKKGHEVIIVDSGLFKAKQDDSHVYLKKSFNLNYTNGIGIGGTTNFWDSGLTCLSDSNYYKGYSDSQKIVLNSLRDNYYIKALKLILGKNADLISQFLINPDKDILNIFYPKKIYKPKLDNNIKIFVESQVLSINNDDKCVYIEIMSDGKIFTINGDFLIFCAGGLGSPGLIKKFFPNMSSWVGHYLVDHPINFFGKIILKKNSIKNIIFKYPFGIIRSGFIIKSPVTGLRHVFFLRPTFDKKIRKSILQKKLIAINNYKNKKYIKLLFNLIDLDILSDALFTKFNISFSNRYYSVFGMIDQSENFNNSIDYEDNKKIITWDITNINYNDFIFNLRKFFIDKKITFLENNLNYQELSSAAHYSNTCKIGDDIKNGVVDLNLQLFGSSNIFICDGSVVPKIGAINTGLTIVALSLRLSDFLNNKAKYNRDE